MRSFASSAWVLLHFVKNPLGALDSIGRGELVRTISLGRRRLHFALDASSVDDVLRDRTARYSWRDGVKSIMTVTGTSAFGVCDGELHRRYRDPIESSFLRDRYSQWDSAVSSVSANLVKSIRECEVVDFTEFVEGFVRDAVLSSLFASDVASLSSKIGRGFRLGFQYMNSPLTLFQVNLPFTPFRRAVKAREGVDRMLEEVIEDRRSQDSVSSPDGFPDIVDNYLGSKDADLFSNKIIRQQVSEIVAAGQETTSAALTWLLYEVNRNPGVRRRLETELRTLTELPSDYRRCNEMRYARAVVSEVLRLHPPVPVAPRTVERAHCVGGVAMAPGDMVVVSQHVRHRDEAVWTNPHDFIPSRWMDEKAAGEARFNYFPFGLGARRCIGHELAKRIMYQFVFALFSNFDLEIYVSNDSGMEGIVTVIPKGRVRIRARSLPVKEMEVM